MKLLLTSIFLATLMVPSFSAQYKYQTIDAANLEKDAKAFLKQSYPTLTSHDIELLYGFTAVHMYNEERGISNDYI